MTRWRLGSQSGRSVVLVCGPPCGGKSTYVEQHKQPGDYVVDFDHFARLAGSPRQWMHSREFGDAAEAMFWQAVDYVAASDDERAWVIRSAPEWEARTELAERLRADEVVLIDPGIDVCLDRARDRPWGTVRAIRWWYARLTTEATWQT